GAVSASPRLAAFAKRRLFPMGSAVFFHFLLFSLRPECRRCRCDHAARSHKKICQIICDCLCLFISEPESDIIHDISFHTPVQCIAPSARRDERQAFLYPESFFSEQSQKIYPGKDQS